MSEYIMGLGVSVKICKIYEELFYLTFSNSDMTKEFYDNVLKLKDLIEDETIAYDKLDVDDIYNYYEKINEEDYGKFDAVKSRYYSKLKERKDLLDDDVLSMYPFSLNTAIVGKILLDSLTNVEKHFLTVYDDETGENKILNDESIYNLYSFHRVHKYTLIVSNDFLERLAVDFNFNICDIPSIGFDKIKKNFRCNDNFDKYLNRVLLVMAKDTIKNLLVDVDRENVNDIYSNLLFISQLEVIISYLDKKYLNKLINYCDSLAVNKFSNGKYVYNLFKKC